jgi:hypothetical protein
MFIYSFREKGAVSSRPVRYSPSMGSGEPHGHATPSGGTNGHRADGGVDVPPHDELFSLLNSSRRRHVVRLLATDGETTFRGLVERIAASETNGRVPSYVERKRVYVSLRQTHLPKLSAAGVIEWERAGGAVRPTPRLDALYRPLQAVDRTLSDRPAGN